MGQEVGNTARNAAGQITGSRQLTAMQQAFVTAYIRNGGQQGAAARSAGYSDPGKDGWYLVRLPHVIAEIKKHHDRTLCGELASLALGVIKTVLESKENDKDSKALRARVALKVVERARIGADEDAQDSAAKALGSMSVQELETFVREYRDKEARTVDITPEVASPGEAKPLATQ